jgi:hypothetical protein
MPRTSPYSIALAEAERGVRRKGGVTNAYTLDPALVTPPLPAATTEDRPIRRTPEPGAGRRRCIGRQPR